MHKQGYAPKIVIKIFHFYIENENDNYKAFIHFIISLNCYYLTLTPNPVARYS